MGAEQIWLMFCGWIASMGSLVVWVVKQQSKTLTRATTSYESLVKERFIQGNHLAERMTQSETALAVSLSKLADAVNNNNQIAANCEDVVMAQHRRRMQEAQKRGEPLSP